jgi:predicted small metal-binding protein
LSHFVVAGISRAKPIEIGRIAKMPAHIDEAKIIACAEIVPECPFTASAATDEELLQKVAAHAAHDHGITEITPELVEKVKAAIKSR